MSCIPSQFLRDIKPDHDTFSVVDCCIPSQFPKMSIKTVINHN